MSHVIFRRHTLPVAEHRAAGRIERALNAVLFGRDGVDTAWSLFVHASETIRSKMLELPIQKNSNDPEYYRAYTKSRRACYDLMRVYHGWNHIALMAASVQIHECIYLLDNVVAKELAVTPSIARHIDLVEFKILRKSLKKVFPNVGRVRAALVHGGEMAVDPESHAMQATDIGKEFGRSGYSKTVDGRMVTFPFDDASYGAYRDIISKIEIMFSDADNAVLLSYKRENRS